MTAPFQNVDKINSLGLHAGDSVLLRRGDIFRGTLIIRQSGSASQPIVFSAYGSGQKPVLSGSVPVTNWTNMGGNIWQAACSSCGSAVTGLYRSGVALPLGRYPNVDAPNKGTLTIRAHTGHYQIFSQESLPDGVDFKGAEVVLRPIYWILDRAIVDAQFGNDALNLIYPSSYDLADNSGFFFQNHPATLDRPGEWCYVATTKNLLLYDTTGTVNAQAITATVNGLGIDIANASYITITNLHITQTLNTSLLARDASNLTLTNLDVTEAGEDGVIILGSGQNIVLTNNQIKTINNNGVWVDFYQHVNIKGNVIRGVGSVPGRGKSGDGQYNGVTLKAEQDVLVENNVIDSIGYNGITFVNNTTIRQNIISNYCISKYDGGGIYAWNGNKAPMSNNHILSNMLYASPNVRGKYSVRDYSIGIFMDDCVENVEIKNNTIFDNTQWGVFLHAANNITFTDNTLFNNYTTQLVVYHNAGYCPVRNDVIKRNIIVSKEASQYVGQYESNADDLLQYGQIDSNYYARPFNEGLTMFGIINSSQGGGLSLNDWKVFSGGLDLHSKSSPITYNQYRNEGSGGINRVNSTFETNADDWMLIYSRYNNAEVTQDNTNKLDGGSLRVSFPAPSGQPNSYAQVIKRVGTLTKGKIYVLRFDAVATTNVNVLVYLRQYGAPYREYDRRYTVSIGPTRQSYELPFTASENEPDAVVLIQIDGEGPTFWLDNVRLQEDVPIQNNPDEFIKLFYNPTLKDSVITLTGVYRDVKNQFFSGSVILKPFTSVILLKDSVSLPPADLTLSLQSDKRVLHLNELNTVQLRIRNQSNTQAAATRWTCRLPANLQFINSNGQPYSDNVLTGSVSQLAPQSDTTFTFFIKPTASGQFRVAAQITTATSPDPDSRPNSGMMDGEDDTAEIDFRVDGNNNVFESPNPNQRLLPAVASNQPTPNSSQADLSLRMEVSLRTPVVGEIITYTLYVSNAGGSAASEVQLQDQLPAGLEVVNSPNWTANGRFLSTTLTTIMANTTKSVSFQARVKSPGNWINQAQINTSTSPDPDSSPGNGFANGEDDQAQTDIRGL